MGGGGLVVGAAVVGAAVVGAAVVGAAVVGTTVVGGGAAVVGGGGATVVGGGITVMVGGGTVTVVTGGFVVVVVSGGLVVVVVTRAIVVDGGWVGTATLSFDESSSCSARNAIPPITHSASTAPATMRAAVTYWVPDFSPRERRMRSAARAASTKATIVPMSGMTMLTIAHTSAAMANGSTRGALPHPPAPPEPAAPVGSGSGPTGTAPVSSGIQFGSSGGSEADIGQHYRPRDGARCPPR